MEFKDVDLHVAPINDLVDHDMSRTCWCQPALKLVCEECDGDGCWCCDDGLLPAGEVDDTVAVLVVHNAADGRE